MMQNETYSAASQKKCLNGKSWKFTEKFTVYVCSFTSPHVSEVFRKCGTVNSISGKTNFLPRPETSEKVVL